MDQRIDHFCRMNPPVVNIRKDFGAQSALPFAGGYFFAWG